MFIRIYYEHNIGKLNIYTNEVIFGNSIFPDILIAIEYFENLKKEYQITMSLLNKMAY